ncbi:MAG: PEGA domain-containing protein, partial [Bacteroidota bacterium]
MKTSAKLVLVLLTISASYINAQLREFVIKELPKEEKTQVIARQTDEAIVTIHTIVKGLSFTSNTGGIVEQRGSDAEGKYLLFVKPEKQFITVKALGFKEENIRLTSIEPRGNYQFTLQEKIPEMEKGTGKLSIITNPSSADVSIDGIPAGKSPYNSPQITVGSKLIGLSLLGYRDTTLVINVEKDKNISRVINLLPQFDVVKYNYGITSIVPLGGLIGRAALEYTENSVIIKYDLNGAPDEDYEVSLVMKSKTDSKIEHTPKFISGDIGEGKFYG